MQLGARIQELLTEKGITQRKLAEDLHLNPNTVNGYIRNRRSPDCETASRIAAYLDTSIDYLLGNNCLRRYPAISLSEKENILLSNYRSLDVHDQHVLDQLSVNLCRMNESYQSGRR